MKRFYPLFYDNGDGVERPANLTRPLFSYEVSGGYQSKINIRLARSLHWKCLRFSHSGAAGWSHIDRAVLFDDRIVVYLGRPWRVDE